MELRQFRYFVSIADLGSVSRASRALHIAQPALSQQIAQLESELGHKLLYRKSSGVSMTEQGEIFYRHAQRVLKQLDSVESELAQSAAQLTGTVCIGLPQSTASMYAMPLLAAIQAHHPGIALEFFDELSGHLLRGLDSGRLDMAMVVSDDDAALLDGRWLFDEQLFAVSRPDIAPAQNSLTPSDIAVLPLALPGHAHGVRGQVEQWARAAGGKLTPPHITANSISIMRQAVKSGLAHSIMPWGAVADELASGTLVATPLSPRLERHVHLCVAKDAALSLAGQAVMSLLQTCIHDQITKGAWTGATLR